MALNTLWGAGATATSVYLFNTGGNCLLCLFIYYEGTPQCLFHEDCLASLDSGSATAGSDDTD